MSKKVSKKDKAFELFDEGKNPSSPEVKALKLKGSTKYNYFRCLNLCTHSHMVAVRRIVVRY